MTHTHSRQPAINQSQHPIPRDTSLLTAPRQRSMPESANLPTEQIHRPTVGRYTVVLDGDPQQPNATTVPFLEWERACAVATRFSPRATLLAAFCEPSAATP